jgi:hypothetical protein
MMHDNSLLRARPDGSALARRGLFRWPWNWRPDPIVPLLALLPLAIFAAQASGRAVFSGHDIQYYFYPYHVAAARLIADGHPPLWNPHAFGGFPMLGDGQTALLYPPNWLFLLPGLPPALALSWAILLQFSIAGLGTYGFARALGLGRAAGFVAAVAYAFGGFMTARIIHLSILAGAAMLPVVLLGIERALRAGAQRPRWFALAAVAVALQLVAGHPQVPIYTLLAVGLLVAVRAVEGCVETIGWRPLLTVPLRAVGIYALGGALAALQLLPWAELAALSPRAAGATFFFVFERSKNGADWLLYLFPYLFGALRPGPYDVVPHIGVGIRVWEQSTYVGILPLALAAIGLAGLFARWHTRGTADAPASHSWGRRFSLAFLALLLLLGVVLAAGWNTPFATYTYALPVLGRLRDVERAAVLVSFALALLAGCGLQRLLDAGEATGERAWRRGLTLLAAVTLILPLGVVWLASRATLPPGLIDRGFVPAELTLLRLNRANALLPLLLAGYSAAFLLIWGRAARSTFRPQLTWLATGLVLLDLGLFAVAFHATADPRLYERVPPVATFLRQQPGLFRTAVYLPGNQLAEREAQERLAVSWGMVYGLQDINGFNSLQPRRYTDYLFGPQQADVSYGNLTDTSLFADSSPVLSSLNVKYLIVPRGAEPQAGLGDAYRLVWEDRAVRVYENDRAYPRAYFVTTTFPAPAAPDTLTIVTSPGFDGRRDALVEGATTLPPDTPLAEGERVVITAYAPDQITLRATATVPRLLVLSEMDFPGWRATIDGQAVPIHRTNYLYRGVIVPPGEHTIEFIYRPASVRNGLIISTLALTLIAALLIAPPLLARRQRRPS